MLHKYCCHVELSFHTALKYVLLRVLLRVSLPRRTKVPVAAYSIALPSRSGEMLLLLSPVRCRSQRNWSMHLISSWSRHGGG